MLIFVIFFSNTFFHDFGDHCRGRTTLYNWKGSWKEGGVEKQIECTDEEDSCAWAICQADKFLAEELVQNYEFGYHKENSANYGFDRNEHCVHRQIFEDEVEIKPVESENKNENDDDEIILPEDSGDNELNLNGENFGNGGNNAFDGFGLRTGGGGDFEIPSNDTKS